MKRAFLQMCLLLSLLGCAQGEAGAPNILRVIIQFAPPITAHDAAFVAQLEASARVRLEYVTSISSTAAAYLLSCDSSDKGCAQAMARLREQAGIVRIAPDRKETIQ